MYPAGSASLYVSLDIISQLLREKLSELGIENVPLLVTEVILMSRRISGGVIQQFCHLIHVGLTLIVNYSHTVLVSDN